MTYHELAHSVREHLGQGQRYAHVIRVARLAERLAAAHGEDTRRARLAGMLHDLARLYSAERLLEECARRRLPIDAFERAHPIVLHARLGAELARERFDVDDELVLDAIRKHTLAGASMSRLDEIVYLADALEGGRSYPQRAGFEKVAFSDIDEAMRLVLRSNGAQLLAKGLQVAPASAAALASREARGRVEHARQTGPSMPELIDIVTDAALDKKAEDVVTLEIGKRSIVADYFVIATGRSKIQTRSIADGIAEAVRSAGIANARTEGYSDGGWILLDLGSVVAHLFTPEARSFYNLERLWGPPVSRPAAGSA